MQNTDSESPAPSSPHALGCARPGCIGSCLKPSDDDSLEVRLARFEEAVLKREKVHSAVAQMCNAVARAKAELDAAVSTFAAYEGRVSAAEEAVDAARAALRGSS